MSPKNQPIIIATRGSALALAQANFILGACRSAFPSLRFEIKIIKTSGDKLQAVAPNFVGEAPSKGLFTKELEVALLNHEADLAVHSLKDLPTDLPDGLTLAAVSKREDVRDVLIFRDAAFPISPSHSGEQTPRNGVEKRGLKPGATLRDFPLGATLATSSTRRQAQLLAHRPDLKLVPIRGNVGTRLRKLAEKPDLDGLVLAAAGLNRLRILISPDGKIARGKEDFGGPDVPEGLLATHLSLNEMLPCVGQGAIGIETRSNDSNIAEICARLNDVGTYDCVSAERAFLRGMGGGCLSPLAAYAEIIGEKLRIRGVSFRGEIARRSEMNGVASNAIALGTELANRLKT